jgi:protein involved in temperature-dependent protein secretion
MCACAQISAGFEHMLRQCWQTIRRGETMKHSAFRGRKLPELPLAWREAEYAALRANAADTCDDRVSESIFDVEDERAEVGIIVDRMIHGAN